MRTRILVACLAPLAIPFAHSRQGTPTSGATGIDSHRVRAELTVSLDRLAAIGSVCHLELHVKGGDTPVELHLLNPPAGLVLEPGPPFVPPFTRRVRWLVPEGTGERVDLHFQLLPTSSSPAGATTPATLVVPVPVLGDSGALVRHGDVSGDGLDDLIAVARLADRQGEVNAGAAFVWLAGSDPLGAPDCVLELAALNAGDQLGEAAAPALQLVDLDRDGILDVLLAAELADVGGATNAGAIFGWLGSPSLQGTRPADVTFRRPNPEADDQLGSLPVLVEDLTGDGVPELIAGSTWADVDTVVNAGGWWVWSLGPSLLTTPEPAPLARLSVPGAAPGDRLGLATGAGVQVIDGDGLQDVVVGASLADRAGLNDAGAIYLWKGSAQLGGHPAPTVELDLTATSNMAAGDQLGEASGQGIQFADVTGDGRLDVVAGARFADVYFHADSGGIFIWKGEQDLAWMSAAPRAEFIVVSGQPGDQLAGGNGLAVQFADLTGDGVLDVLAAAENADQGSGELYLFEGGPYLSGPADPTCFLRGDDQGERLGQVSGQGVLIVDVNVDGRLDVLAGASLADVGSRVDAGKVFGWDGATSFDQGVPPVSWVLEAPDLGGPQPSDGDRLGDVTGPGLQLFDVTGDSWLDLIAGAAEAEVNGFEGVGAVHVWEGGPGFDGGYARSLVASDHGPGDRLGRGTGQGVRVLDLTGDGTLDLVAGGAFVDHLTVPDAGAFIVWRGGSDLGAAPEALILRAANPSAGDRLGEASAPSVVLADVTGDMVDDLIVSARSADPTGVPNSGAVYVWEGSSLLSGPGTSEPPPASVLTSGGVGPGDQLGYASTGMLVFDQNGDTLLDLVVPAPFADHGGVVNSGALYLWRGGGAIGVEPAPMPDGSGFDPTATAGDLLGG